jgi:hypothetical protein
MPVLVLWGRQDLVIPATHAEAAPSHDSAYVHVFDDCGHFPHRDHPEEFSRLVLEFVAANEPAQYHRGKWRALLRRGDQYALESVAPLLDEDVAPAIR